MYIVCVKAPKWLKGFLKLIFKKQVIKWVTYVF